MAHAGGRPTKRTRRLVEKAKSYAGLYVSLGEAIPSIEGLCDYIGINRNTAYEWKENNKQFANIMDDIMQKQAKTLFNGGIVGKWNPTIAKLLLSKHGYREGVDVTSDGKSVVTPINYVKPQK